MTTRDSSPLDHPVRLLRFLLALLLLLPALLSGYTLHGPAILDVVLPVSAAVLVFPASGRHRLAGIALGVLGLAVVSMDKLASVQTLRVLMVTLAIVGFFAWARWASRKPG